MLDRSRIIRYIDGRTNEASTMNRLPLEKRTQIVHLLCEGNSLRATSRIADVSINTVTKLLVEVGSACQNYHDEHVRGLKSTRIECDEIWSFVYAKQDNVPNGMKGEPGVGDVWTWTALDSNSKLIITWLVGERTIRYAKIFMQD